MRQFWVCLPGSLFVAWLRAGSISRLNNTVPCEVAHSVWLSLGGPISCCFLCYLQAQEQRIHSPRLILLYFLLSVSFAHSLEKAISFIGSSDYSDRKALTSYYDSPWCVRLTENPGLSQPSSSAGWEVAERLSWKICGIACANTF